MGTTYYVSPWLVLPSCLVACLRPIIPMLFLSSHILNFSENGYFLFSNAISIICYESSINYDADIMYLHYGMYLNQSAVNFVVGYVGH